MLLAISEAVRHNVQLQEAFHQMLPATSEAVTPEYSCKRTEVIRLAIVQVDLRCSRLEETHLGSRRATQGSPSGARSLRTVVLHSHAVRSLRLRGFRELRSVMLQCQTLASLDLSACEELNDSIFSELSSALPGTGCPNLRQAQCTDVRWPRGSFEG